MHLFPSSFVFLVHLFFFILFSAIISLFFLENCKRETYILIPYQHSLCWLFIFKLIENVNGDYRNDKLILMHIANILRWLQKKPSFSLFFRQLFQMAFSWRVAETTKTLCFFFFCFQFFSFFLTLHFFSSFADRTRKEKKKSNENFFNLKENKINFSFFFLLWK